MPGRPPRRETGSSTSTTSPSPAPPRSCTSWWAGGRRSSSTATGWQRPRGRSSTCLPASSGRRFAEEPGTTLVAIGATPGEVYEPDGWELWAPLHPLYAAGRYDEAADRG